MNSHADKETKLKTINDNIFRSGDMILFPKGNGPPKMVADLCFWENISFVCAKCKKVISLKELSYNFYAEFRKSDNLLSIDVHIKCPNCGNISVYHFVQSGEPSLL